MTLLLNGEKVGVLRCERLKFRAWYELANGRNLHICYPLGVKPYDKTRTLKSVDTQEAPERKHCDPWAVRVTVYLGDGTALRSLKGTYCPREDRTPDVTIKVDGEECQVLGKESSRSTEKEWDDKSRKKKDREYYNVRLHLDQNRELSIWGRLEDFPGPAMREHVPESINMPKPDEQEILRRCLSAPFHCNVRRVIYRDETGFPHECFLDVSLQQTGAKHARRRIGKKATLTEQDLTPTHQLELDILRRLSGEFPPKDAKPSAVVLWQRHIMQHETMAELHRRYRWSERTMKLRKREITDFLQEQYPEKRIDLNAFRNARRESGKIAYTDPAVIERTHAVEDEALE